jgi:hypothetical protein
MKRFWILAAALLLSAQVEASEYPDPEEPGIVLPVITHVITNYSHVERAGKYPEYRTYVTQSVQSGAGTPCISFNHGGNVVTVCAPYSVITCPTSWCHD